MRTDRGFSLVELLVVIAIVMLLVAFLLPVMRSMRAAAMQVGCASNMRQLMLGIKTYANDNRGRIPYTGTVPPSVPAGEHCWIGYYHNHRVPDEGTVFPYILEKRIYICPADSKWRNPGLNVCWVSPVATHSYSIPSKRNCMPFDLQSATSALMVDEAERTINDGEFNNHWDALASYHVISGWGAQERTRAGCNILFCDGRVEFFKTTDIVFADHPMFN